MGVDIMYGLEFDIEPFIIVLLNSFPRFTSSNSYDSGATHVVLNGVQVPFDAQVTQSTNYAGAAIFILYIIAALILTSLIILELLKSYNAIPNTSASTSMSSSNAFRRTIHIFTLLALLSFTILSSNMLSFLLLSYSWWNQSHIRGAITLSSIWEWTTTSSLFLDFARELCRDGLTFKWSGEALAATMVANVFMSAVGTSI